MSTKLFTDLFVDGPQVVEHHYMPPGRLDPLSNAPLPPPVVQQPFYVQLPPASEQPAGNNRTGKMSTASDGWQ